MWTLVPCLTRDLPRAETIPTRRFALGGVLKMSEPPSIMSRGARVPTYQISRGASPDIQGTW